LFRRGCGDFCVLNIERNSRTLTSYIPATTATALWNAAWTGPHRADGISHEIFIQRAIQDHMTGPQGKLQKEHPHWFVLWLIQCFFFFLCLLLCLFVGLFLYVAVYLCAAGDYGFITQKLWEQALTTTVINGMKVFPHPIVGFNQLKSRIQNQRERAKKLSTSTFPKLHQVSSCLCTDQLSHVECCLVVVVLVVGVLLLLLLLLLFCWTGTQADRLKELARTNRATLISTKMKIETERKKQLELRQKTIAVMKLVER